MYPTVFKFCGNLLVILFVWLVPVNSRGQTRFLAQAPANQRLPLFWRYCANNLISDWDSAASHRFLGAVATTADSLGDKQLKSYALYFKKQYRLHFSENYKQYFPPGDYEAIVKLLARTQAWAHENNYPDIAAACEHITGEVYFQAARYGPAFEHLLKAQKAFQDIGYAKVPNAASYLFELGLRYYQFEDYHKALTFFLAATRYPFYLPRMQINTLNTIGLIYARQRNWPQAQRFYRKTMAQAAANQDTVWVGISLGNLGQAFLTQSQNDSALFYLRRSYTITSNIKNRAPEDAAYSSLAMAKAFIRQQQPDSGRYYLRASQQLARAYIREATKSLEYREILFGGLIELNETTGNYKIALQLSDSLGMIKDSLQKIQDGRILTRAANKVEVARYQGELKLLEIQKNLGRLRYYILLFAMLGIVAFGTLFFNRYRMRKKRQFELAKKEKELLALQKKLAEDKWQHAENLLAAYLNTLKDKTQLIDKLTTELQGLNQNGQPAQAAPMTNQIEQLVSAIILTEEDWQQFRDLFDQTYPGFVYRLRDCFPDLSPAETRMLILTKLKLSNREMAHMLGISVDAIRKANYRLRKKFNLEEETALDALIQNI